MSRDFGERCIADLSLQDGFFGEAQTSFSMPEKTGDAEPVSRALIFSSGKPTSLLSLRC